MTTSTPKDLIAAMQACADACTMCADACLGETDVQKMVNCIRLDLDCADICQATARIFARKGMSAGPAANALLTACAEACKACGDECEAHGQHGMKHCQVCAEACRRCEQACRQAMQTA